MNARLALRLMCVWWTSVNILCDGRGLHYQRSFKAASGVPLIEAVGQKPGPTLLMLVSIGGPCPLCPSASLPLYCSSLPLLDPNSPPTRTIDLR